MSQMTQLSPACRRDPSSVRSTSSCQSATWAKLVQIFDPLTISSSPSIRPRVLMPARSDPAPGSEKPRSEEHTSELQSLMRISYAVYCLKKKKTDRTTIHQHNTTTRIKQH